MYQFTRIVRMPPALIALGLLLGCLALLAAGIGRAANIPDPGFGTNGIVTLPVSGQSIRVAELSDDSIQVAISSVPAGSDVTGTVNIIRLSADGSLDRRYGTAGIARFDVPSLGEFQHSSAILPTGIVFLTSFSQTYTLPNPGTLFVRRVFSDGMLDRQFAGDGRLEILRFVPLSQVSVRTYPRSNGRTLLSMSGYEFVSSPVFGISDRKVVRNAMLLASGELDPTFGSQGIAESIFFPGRASQIGGAIVNADDSYVAYGSVDYSPSDSDLALAKYRADGTPDLGFGTGGLVEIDLDRGRDSVFQRDSLPDGRLFAVVNSQATNSIRQSAWLVMRFLPNGQIDSTFGSSGRITITTYSLDPTLATPIMIQTSPDGSFRLLERVGQSRCNGPAYGLVLSGWTASGERDPAYGRLGRAPIQMPYFNSVVHQAQFDQQGRLLIAATGYPYGPQGNQSTQVTVLSRSQPGSVPLPTPGPFHLFLPTNASCPVSSFSRYGPPRSIGSTDRQGSQ